MRAHDRATHSSLYKLGPCRFSADDLKRLELLTSGTPFSTSEVEKLRKASSVAPPPLGPKVKLANSHFARFARLRPALLPWVAEVCGLREEFHKCRFLVAGNTAD